ncbi:hypothetical protein A3K86_20080 [Photobacterium jeanii]|uniref:DUF218 domain-containing protein n=1 Tax=Photobacterium jeanii TaxID=858640 RepID=A0A178K2C6_9GAMM|nr:YdcF family protein [Photobacterium jeanii]OAN11257.1 hypothetical protein A3K86_20080 [Photobacterium jeanii]PST90777.1 YdcF family protein [Photobacterium jeanii]
MLASTSITVTDNTTMLTHHIEAAYKAYCTPNRHHFEYDNQCGSNLDGALHYLALAHSAAPTQIDIAITQANILSFQGKLSSALHLYRRCVTQANSEAEYCLALTYLMVWHHYLAEHELVEHYRQQLHALSPQVAIRVTHLLRTLEATLVKPINYELAKVSIASPQWAQRPIKHSAIVVLGYKLNNDGTIPEMLEERLQTALTVINATPECPVIVTGGLAQNGITEAQAMKAWLVDHHVPVTRIWIEDQATNTLDNASYTLDILHQLDIDKICLVSASIHVHRSEIIFATTQLTQPKAMISVEHYAVKDGLSTGENLKDKVRLDCYIDALRSFGLPAFNCLPFIQA